MVNYEECIDITVENRICEYFIKRIVQVLKGKSWDSLAMMFEEEKEIIENEHSKWRRRIIVFTDLHKYQDPKVKDDEIYSYLK